MKATTADNTYTGKGGLSGISALRLRTQMGSALVLGLFVSRLPLSLFFSNAGKQTKPVCFLSKGRSGPSGKAYIEGCFLVSRSDVGGLFWAKRHPCGCRWDSGSAQFIVRPLGGPRRSKQTLLEKLRVLLPCH
jgi:hypothetical protein